MKLSKLLEGLSYKAEFEDREITTLCCDTRQVKEGSLFFAFPGKQTDGHKFVPKALEMGAAFAVVERDVGIKNQIIVPDTKKAYAECCANLYDNPQKKVKLIGVTGTNGKTSTTYLVKDILAKAGYRVGLIGTVVNETPEAVIPSKFTTPDSLSFYSLMHEMVKAKCEYVVVEVSSFGLEQRRIWGCHFEISLFTNLTQDHLDYHDTMENYYQAKKLLFDVSDKGIIAVDDSYGVRLAKEVPCEVRTFSIKDDSADYTAKNIELTMENTSYEFVGKGVIGRIKYPCLGMFSVSNSMGAVAIACEMGIDGKAIKAAIAEAEGVPGRFERIKVDTPFTVIRDFAHTPDGLEKALDALRAVCKDGRIVVLFGNAGNRDRSKRAKMVRTVAERADFVVLSSDNPRHEDEMQIINDGLPGFEGLAVPHKVIPDRYEAITWALSNCNKGDILLLAGKGHEDYQVLDHGTIHFDEREIVSEIWENLKNREE